MEKIEFWGRDEQDERLLEEVLAGLKTATCTLKVWYDALPEEEQSEVLDVVEVFTKKGEHRGTIRMTDKYEIAWGHIKGDIGERIAKGENSTLEEFIEDHIFSWKKPLENEGIPFNEETVIVVEHFELVSVVE
ncbi:ASCH domain-containing protein [Salinibacillus xinjiangensis]|nr:ASCH domain-containing protein [Salinibacillus xinjiangensis]